MKISFVITIDQSAVGVIWSRINFQLAITVAFLTSALLTLSVAFLRQLWLLLFIFVLNGFCLGFFEAGSNVYILQLWGKETAPFMQAIHFMFGSGALIAPLIAEPFLIIRNETAEALHDHEDEEMVFHPENVRLLAPYSVVAGILIFNAILNLLIYKIYPVTTEHPSRSGNKEPEVQPPQQLESVDDKPVKMGIMQPDKIYTKAYKYWKILTIGLVLLFMHIYLGLEISFGSFLMTFAVNSHLKLSKATGAHLTTLFWSTFTFIRVLTILVIQWAGNAAIILVSMTIVLIASAILAPFGNDDEQLLWIGVALIGIGMSSVWACIFGYLEEFFPVTSVIGSLMICSAVLGEFVFPVIISAFIKDYPQVFLWVVTFCAVSIFVLFLIISLICRKKLSPIKTSS